jgi:hypothetical protein
MTPRAILIALALGAAPAVLAAQHVHPAAAPASAPAAARAQDAPAEPLTPAGITGAPPLSADTRCSAGGGSSGAIRLGEVVDVALTCAVPEARLTAGRRVA